MDIYRYSSREKQFLLRMLGLGAGSIFLIYRLGSFYQRNGIPEKTLTLLIFGVIALFAIMLTNLFICELKGYMQNQEFYLSINGQKLLSRSLAFQGEKAIDLNQLKFFSIKAKSRKQLLKLTYLNNKSEEVYVLLCNNDPRINILEEQLGTILEQQPIS